MAFKGATVVFDVKVKPDSKRESISFENGVIVVKIREKPVEGKANKALIEKLAKTLGIAKSCIEIVGGERSKSKRVAIDCIDEKKIYEMLKEA